eukprot:gnl/TRDRNA2_/TRDRNA2_172659_c1_seq1.p1 gnl/TRDRNA2_/TRDRNA2_172659_c1~~gnl/TRDRNA2_/TRDRNA2_172659_c1_seq1.p1  ORF type:complete len:601 (-),score=82.68 gnl/TRDRNA2_/TRDRNA2_172659_c1_seq1:329-2056(-)
MALAHGHTRALLDAGILAKARYMTTSSASIGFAIALYHQEKFPVDIFLGKSLSPEELSPENLTGPDMGSYLTSLGWPFYRRYPKGMGEKIGVLDTVFSDLESKLRSEVEAHWGLKEGFLEQAWHCLQNACTCLVEAHWGLKEGFLEQAWHCLQNACTCLVEELIPEGTLQELWIFVSGFATFREYGITDRNSVYCSPSQLQRVRAQMGDKAKIFTTRDVELNLPFLISQTAVLAPFSGTDPKTNPLFFFPLEHTPLYAGIQGSYNESQAGPYKGLGDMLVEPFGWSSEARAPLINTSGAPVPTKLRRRRNAANLGDLAEWMGQGTCYPCVFQADGQNAHHSHCTVAAIEKLSPHSWSWSPLLKDAKGVPISQHLPTGDAGIYDDLGHLPLLRRKVKKMVIYDSSAVHDNATAAHEDIFEMTYLFAAFGQANHGIPNSPLYPAGASNPQMSANQMTVFEPSEFAPLLAKIKALHAARKPVVIRDSFTVVDNAHFGIVGGWKVEIIWVLQLPVAEWRAALPAHTGSSLPSYFPNYLAGEAANHFEMGALSQFASWIDKKYVVPEINAMLEEASQVFV